jgi:proline iminopeptidase
MARREGFVTCGDGVRLFFTTVGDGPEVVVIPNGIYLVDDFARLATGRTLVFFDLRNRGRSDAVVEAGTLRGDILQDAHDMYAMARHFGQEYVDVVGHSFAGLLAVLYAFTYPTHVNRVIQIGPMPPNPDAQYPAHLTAMDGTFRDVMARLAELQREREVHDPEAFCHKAWAALRPLYVTDAADADQITWARCDLPNERGAMRYYMEQTLPSIRRLNLTAARLTQVQASVLTIHGAHDRSAPYGGGREWAMTLPAARLVTIDGGGHAPWIEAPEEVFGAMETFLSGGWPPAAQTVTELDPPS